MSDTDNDFDLDSLRTVISEKYKPVRMGIGEGRSVTLRQIARLNDDEQSALIDMQAEFNELQKEGARLNSGVKDVTPKQLAEWRAGLDHEPTGEEVDAFKREVSGREVTHEEVKAYRAKAVGVLERMLILVATSRSDGEELVAACGHDELILMEVFSRYSKKTKLGEASASSSSSESTAGPSSTTSESSSDSTSGQ